MLHCRTTGLRHRQVSLFLLFYLWSDLITISAPLHASAPLDGQCADASPLRIATPRRCPPRRRSGKLRRRRRSSSSRPVRQQPDGIPSPSLPRVPRAQPVGVEPLTLSWGSWLLPAWASTNEINLRMHLANSAPLGRAAGGGGKLSTKLHRARCLAALCAPAAPRALSRLPPSHSATPCGACGWDASIFHASWDQLARSETHSPGWRGPRLAS